MRDLRGVIALAILAGCLVGCGSNEPAPAEGAVEQKMQKIEESGAANPEAGSAEG